MQPLIHAKNLNFTYNAGKSNEYQALINIAFDIYPEEFVILFGPSGCGKSTLLNIIAGLETPAPDTVWVNDIDVAKMTKKQHANYHRKVIGMVFQAYNLISSLSVIDNVGLPQIFLNEHKGKREIKAMELLERFGIKKHAHKMPAELSGGQQQRIGIARSIVNDPQIILADEPVGNLDSISAKNVLEILKELNEKEKKTVIMVTHNPENLEYADRVFHMKDGIITKETVNEDKNPTKKNEEIAKAPTRELSDLMRAYAGLNPDQINILIMPYKAKVFTHHFITTRNMEETKIFEDLMQRRLMGTITPEEFLEILNRPSNEGGVGFSLKTAEKINEHVEQVLRVASFINQKYRQGKNDQGQHEVYPDQEKAKHVTEFLIHAEFQEYKKQLDEVKINRLERAVFDRITGQISKPELYSALDLPFSDNGVGLNSKTARSVTELLEMILVLGYGMVQPKMVFKKPPAIIELPVKETTAIELSDSQLSDPKGN